MLSKWVAFAQPFMANKILYFLFLLIWVVCIAGGWPMDSTMAVWPTTCHGTPPSHPRCPSLEGGFLALFWRDCLIPVLRCKDNCQFLLQMIVLQRGNFLPFVVFPLDAQSQLVLKTSLTEWQIYNQTYAITKWRLYWRALNVAVECDKLGGCRYHDAQAKCATMASSGTVSASSVSRPQYVDYYYTNANSLNTQMCYGYFQATYTSDGGELLLALWHDLCSNRGIPGTNFDKTIYSINQTWRCVDLLEHRAYLGRETMASQLIELQHTLWTICVSRDSHILQSEAAAQLPLNDLLNSSHLLSSTRSVRNMQVDYTDSALAPCTALPDLSNTSELQAQQISVTMLWTIWWTMARRRQAQYVLLLARLIVVM